jgi:hypothetical protein
MQESQRISCMPFHLSTVHICIDADSRKVSHKIYALDPR